MLAGVLAQPPGGGENETEENQGENETEENSGENENSQNDHDDSPQITKTLLVSHLLPLVNCTLGQTYEPSAVGPKFSGYTIKLMEQVMYEAFPGENLKFQWVHYYHVEDMLKNNEAWAAVGGIPIDTYKLEQGFQFSLPTLHTGMHLVSLGKDKEDYWQWLKSFTAGLWAAILLTGFFLGFVFYAIEQPKFNPDGDFDENPGVIAGIWHSMSSLTMMSDKSTRKCGARLVLGTFWLLILILMTSYTADLTARLETSKVETTVSDTDDIDGETVGLDYLYAGTGAEYGATEELYDEHEEIQKMIQALKDKDLVALILDNPVAEYWAAIECDLFEVGESFHDINYAVMLPPNADEDQLEKLNSALLEAFEDGLALAYQNEYFLVPSTGSCSEHQTGEPYTLVEFAGVFFIIAGTVFVAIVIKLVQIYLRRRNNRKKNDDLPESGMHKRSETKSSPPRMSKADDEDSVQMTPKNTPRSEEEEKIVDEVQTSLNITPVHNLTDLRRRTAKLRSVLALLRDEDMEE